MKSLVVALLVSLSGCLTFGGHGALAGPVSGAPVRPLSGGAEVGTYFGTERVIVNPVLTVGNGPLGDSAGYGELGVRGFYSLPWKPYAAFARIGHNTMCTDPPCQRSTSVVLGASLFTASDDDAIIDGMAAGLASLNLGVIYRRQGQDDIGDGHFLGIELSVTLGFEMLSAINGLQKQHDANRR